MAWYVDSSAAMKVLVEETESTAMRRWWTRSDTWSCELIVTELHRGAARCGVPIVAIEAVLDEVSIVMPSTTTFLTAGGLVPTTLRSLDALHVAAALELQNDLDGFVTYDTRQASAADLNGLVVFSPGRSAGWWN